jgi:two-component system chemotaxis sensor kinase CheA
VEDTPFFLKVVKSYLEIAGYEVITAENGEEALNLLKQTCPDVVVSDIEMPIMTGIELVRAIRADERLKKLPVIALTSLRGESNKEKGLRAGFDMYEYKLDRMRLLESLEKALQK